MQTLGTLVPLGALGPLGAAWGCLGRQLAGRSAGPDASGVFEITNVIEVLPPLGLRAIGALADDGVEQCVLLEVCVTKDFEGKHWRGWGKGGLCVCDARSHSSLAPTTAEWRSNDYNV